MAGNDNFKPYPMPKTAPKAKGDYSGNDDATKSSNKPMPKRMGGKMCPKR